MIQNANNIEIYPIQTMYKLALDTNELQYIFPFNKKFSPLFAFGGAESICDWIKYMMDPTFPKFFNVETETEKGIETKRASI